MEAVNTKELHIKGLSAGSGAAIGEVVIINTESSEVEPRPIRKSDIKPHKKRFTEAKNQLISELKMMGTELRDSDSADIIETQIQIIEDPDIEWGVFKMIETEQLCVEFSLYKTFERFIERLKESGSELFRQRIVDLEDIRDRFIAVVTNQENIKSIKKGSIIVTRDLSPTELVAFYEDGAAGLVMEKGGVTAHAAIIAKSLGLPCVVNADNVTHHVQEDEEIILDASAGVLIKNPEQKTIKTYRQKIKARIEGAKKRGKLKSVTTDGVEFHLMANLEFEAELKAVEDNDAKGIGLLRTESLLFGHRIRKSEEEQVMFYSKILEGSEGPVTIRLFDIGGDKSSIKVSKEANPFLGWRGIRLLLDEKGLLRNQLRAICKVSGKYPGRIKILVPMISVLEEVFEIKKELESAKEEVRAGGDKIDEHLPVGIMVEVPSVAVSAYKFAREVDFLSIGTNDLTQYTLAVDRGNERIYSLFQHYHPSVLQLISLTKEGADKAGVDLSVCGELAGNEIGASCLMGFGINEFSMVPSQIPVIQELLSLHSLDEFKAFAQKALECSTSSELEEFYQEWNNK